jgi:hypothetical protein
MESHRIALISDTHGLLRPEEVPAAGYHDDSHIVSC